MRRSTKEQEIAQANRELARTRRRLEGLQEKNTGGRLGPEIVKMLKEQPGLLETAMGISRINN